MDHQAFGSSDQRGFIDRPMGERSCPIEICMSSTHIEHWHYTLKGNETNKRFAVVSRRRVKVMCSHEGVSYLP